MTFNEWWGTISFEARRNFVEMSAFALRRIAEMAWNKSREEALIEIANLKHWELVPKVVGGKVLPDNEEIRALEEGD